MYSDETIETSSHRRLAIAVRHSFGQLQWDLEWRGGSGTEEDPPEDNSEASKIICLPKRPDDIESDNVTIIVRYIIVLVMLASGKLFYILLILYLFKALQGADPLL